MANNTQNQKPNFHQNHNQNPNFNQTGFLDLQNLLKPSPSGPTFPVPAAVAAAASSSSYPPPTTHHFHMQQQPPTSPVAGGAGGGGARLMALLNTGPTQAPLDPSPTQPAAAAAPVPYDTSAPSSSPSAASPVRLPSRKAPRGRHLIGDRVVYDVDVRFQGEKQPQLEVTPITKYASDPSLLVGRQIAVNRSYICYGLKPGTIRVLDINTALRALLRGHTQRVTDMAFFAEDVPVLASASVDGKVFIWKINEVKDEEDKPQIAGMVVLAIQFAGDGKPVHPRLCWHPHKQENLMVAIGNCILKIDMLRVGRGKRFSAQEPLICPIDKLIDGIVLVGKHDGEITELSMCQWMTSRLASASMDGVVKIWQDRKASPLAVFRPHDGQPVNSVTFLTAPHRPDHIVLITAGPLNRELKIWTSTSEEGWLLPGDAESWQCTQTLEIISSTESKLEEAFFNQAVALPRAGLFLLANAKKNAIYVVHLEYGPYPAATRMDYIAEFTVSMRILSLTGTSDSLPDGDHVVQIYCVQTQAIQQYALDLSQCLPPPIENAELEKTKSAASQPSESGDGCAMLESSYNTKPSEMTVASVAPMPRMSPENSPATSRLAKISSDITSSTEVSSSCVDLPNSSETNLNPQGSDKPVIDRFGQRVDFVKENVTDAPSSRDNLRNIDKAVMQDETSVANPAVSFKHPTHLITPAEILSTATSSTDSSCKAQNVVTKTDKETNEVGVEASGEMSSSTNDEDKNNREPPVIVPQKKERAFYSQASGLSFQMARDCGLETYTAEGTAKAGDFSAVEALEHPSNSSKEGVRDVIKDVPKADESETLNRTPVQVTKGKKQKGKNSQPSGQSSSSPSPFNSTGSSNEPDGSSDAAQAEAALPQLSAMKAMLDQLMGAQKELQKQMSALVSVPIAKEGRRLEGTLGRSMEKAVKASSDALWARLQEENAKQEKLERDHTQQITNLINNSINRDLPTMLEKSVKKEIAAIGPVIARSMTQALEKTVSAAITESFQRGVGEKAVAQLEKSVSSKLETTMARQIQSQFQTSGKQALQDALKSSLEASIIPAFESSCKNMFEQVDATFQKGFVKHTSAAQQQFESTHSPLAVALRDAINSASTVTRTLSGELADGQRKLLAFAAAGANSKAANPLTTQLSNGPLAALQEMAEAPVDPLKELSRLVAERKFEEAFTGALQKSDVSIVSWLCSQVDLPGILSLIPLPLSQGVLLALLQQLACDISNDTKRKLSWMTEVSVAINPADSLIAMHVRPIFEQVYQILGHQRNLPTTSPSDANSIRLLMHVINSVLMSCK